MGSKMAISFANILMTAVEAKLINRSVIKAVIWKRYNTKNVFFSTEYIKRRGNKHV